MAKVKVKRKSTRIDMTAMSDVTVLLLTFFMLTSTFVQKELVQVATPGSVSEIKIPETDILQILVDPSGRIFLSLDKQQDRTEVLKAIGKQYSIDYTTAQVNSFKLLTSFGAPVESIKALLAMPVGSRDAAMMTSSGIPCNSTNNQLKDWVRLARVQNPDLRIAIKADAQTPYVKIKNIMKSLQEIRENRYNLITSLKVIVEDKK